MLLVLHCMYTHEWFLHIVQWILVCALQLCFLHCLYSCSRIEAVQGARHEAPLHLRCRLHRYASSTILGFSYSAAVRHSSEYCSHEKFLPRKIYHRKTASGSFVWSRNLIVGVHTSWHVESKWRKKLSTADNQWLTCPCVKPPLLATSSSRCSPQNDSGLSETSSMEAPCLALLLNWNAIAEMKEILFHSCVSIKPPVHHHLIYSL